MCARDLLLKCSKSRFWRQQDSVGKDAFLEQFHAFLSAFSTLQTAEFQVIRIEARPGGGLRTRVRYELVGSGPGFHREQRVGWWNLEWESTAPDQYLLRSWQSTEETRSRSAQPWYYDIASQAFGHAPSYGAQLLRGVDYWRTVLDGASGIDVYGHNGVSVGDIDGDGFDDLYVCQPAGLPGPALSETGVTEPSKTLPRLPESGRSRIRPVRFSPTSPIPAARTWLSCAPAVRCCF